MHHDDHLLPRHGAVPQGYLRLSREAQVRQRSGNGERREPVVKKMFSVVKDMVVKDIVAYLEKHKYGNARVTAPFPDPDLDEIMSRSGDGAISRSFFFWMVPSPDPDAPLLFLFDCSLFGCWRSSSAPFLYPLLDVCLGVPGARASKGPAAAPHTRTLACMRLTSARTGSFPQLRALDNRV